MHLIYYLSVDYYKSTFPYTWHSTVMCNLMYSLEIVLSIFNQKNLADINARRYTMLNLENMHYSSSPVEECLCKPWRSVSEVINTWVFLYTGVKAGQNYELSKTQPSMNFIDFSRGFSETKKKTNKQTIFE